MNPQLKADIDLLLEGTHEQSSAAREKLGLLKKEPQLDPGRFEAKIWNTYSERKIAEAGAFKALRDFIMRPWVIPVFALATILATVGLSMFGGGVNPPVKVARFDYSQNSVNAFTFHEKVRVHLRQAQGFEIQGKGQNFEIAAGKIWAQFEFEKKPGNSLAIKTQHGIFSVTGTSFLLFSDEKEAVLLVEEGTVQVEKGGKKLAVTANEQYLSRRGEFTSLPIPPEERRIFAAFRNPLLKNDAPEILAKKEAPQSPLPAPPRIIFINVTLFDGNSISGQLINETADALVIQPKNFKAITVRKTEIKESERN